MRNIERVSTVAMVVLVVTMVFGSGNAAFAQASAVEAPTYTVGDEWKFTYGPVKVVAIDGDLVVRQLPSDKQCGGDCRFYSNGQGVLVKVLKTDGSEFKHPNIGFPGVSFPLSVGKEWEYSWQFFNEKSNVSLPFKQTYRVVAYEDVQTKAGVFKAFKILVNRQRVRSSFDGPGQRLDWGSSVHWYSPDAKAVVKRQVLSTGAAQNYGNDYELESYSVK